MTKSATVSITVTAASPVLSSLALAATTSTAIAAGGSVTFSVSAKSQSGSPMSGVSGQLTEGGTAVAPFTTGTDGTATVILKFATAGTYVVGALSGAVASNTVSVTATSPTGIPGSIVNVLVTPGSVAPGANFVVTGTLLDTSGVGLAGAKIDFFHQGGSTTVPDQVTATQAGGNFSQPFTVAIGTPAGTYILILEVEGYPNVTATTEIVVT